MNWHAEKDFRLITGKSRTGKTTLWLSQMQAPGAKWIFVFDPDREYAIKTGIGSCTTVDHMVLAASNHRPVAFYPYVMFPGNPKEAFAFWSRWVMNVCRSLNGVKRVGVDEIWKLTTVHQNGVPPGFEEMMHEGGRNEIQLRLISQYLAQVNIAVRAQLDLIYSFQHSEPSCLKWLAECSFNPAEIEALPPKGVYLVRDRNICTTTKGGSYAPASHGKRKRNP